MDMDENEIAQAVENIEICRTCSNYFYSEEVKFVDVFQESNDETQFLLKLLSHWNIEITPTDGLPAKICPDCYTKFSLLNMFRMECVEADKKLHAMMQEMSICNNNNDNLVESLEKSNTSSNATIMTNNNNNNGEINPFGVSLDLPNIGETNVSELMGDITTMDLQNFNMYAQKITDAEPQESAMAFGNAENDFYTAAEPANPQIPTASNNNGELEQSLQSIAERLEKEQQENQEPPSKKVKPSLDRDASTDEDVDDNDDDDDASSTSTDSRSLDRLGGNPFTCQYCYCSSSGPIEHLVFPTSDALSQHFFDMHDPTYPYNCPHCTQDFKSPKIRDKHVRLQHAFAFRNRTCDYCHKILRTSMDVHQYNCIGVADFVCNVCSHVFAACTLSEFRRHQRIHNPVKNYKCNTCARIFVRRAHFEAHERTHERGDEAYPCNECEMAFKDDYERRRHKYLTHNGAMPVTCDTCRKGFASKAFLERHMRNMHVQSEEAEILRCNNCDTIFPSRLKYRYHMQRPRDKHGKCAEPLKVSRQPAQRQRTDGVLFCPVCPKRFPGIVDRAQHLLEHRGMPRSYKCDLCPLRCRTQYEVSQHLELVHFQLKRYPCDECSQLFSSSSTMQEHKKLFHSRLSVSCPESKCSYQFCNGPNLLSHIRKNHVEVACEYCGDLYTPQWLKKHHLTEHFIHSDDEESPTRPTLHHSQAEQTEQLDYFEALSNEPSSAAPSPAVSYASASPVTITSENLNYTIAVPYNQHQQ